MIRKTTPVLIVFAAFISTTVGAEPQRLLPTQPQLPASHMAFRTTQAQTTPQPILAPVPESTHDVMLSSEGYGNATCSDCPSQPAHFATWWSNTWAGRLVHKMCEDTHKANEWPEPFIQYDREATRVAFTTMTEKGWKRQNTLGNVHFDPDTGDLNMSGRFKVRRIVLEGLPNRRDLFVYRAHTPDKTDARLNSVKSYVDRLAGNAPKVPQVSVTNLPSQGWPAQYVDAISRKFIDTMPDPRLPDKTEANFTED